MAPLNVSARVFLPSGVLGGPRGTSDSPPIGGRSAVAASPACGRPCPPESLQPGVPVHSASLRWRSESNSSTTNWAGASRYEPASTQVSVQQAALEETVNPPDHQPAPSPEAAPPPPLVPSARSSRPGTLKFTRNSPASPRRMTTNSSFRSHTSMSEAPPSPTPGKGAEEPSYLLCPRAESKRRSRRSAHATATTPTDHLEHSRPQFSNASGSYSVGFSSPSGMAPMMGFANIDKTIFSNLPSLLSARATASKVLSARKRPQGPPRSVGDAEELREVFGGTFAEYVVASHGGASSPKGLQSRSKQKAGANYFGPAECPFTDYPGQVSVSAALLVNLEDLPRHAGCTWRDAAPELALCDRSPLSNPPAMEPQQPWHWSTCLETLGPMLPLSLSIASAQRALSGHSPSGSSPARAAPPQISAVQDAGSGSPPPGVREPIKKLVVRGGPSCLHATRMKTKGEVFDPLCNSEGFNWGPRGRGT